MTDAQMTNYLLARLIGLQEGETAEEILRQGREYYNRNKPKKERDEDFDFKSALIQYGVDANLARDFCRIRKAKKAINTESAFNLLMVESDKAGILLKEAVKIAVEHNWSAFKDEWYWNLTHKGQQEPTKTQPKMSSIFDKEEERPQ